TMYCGTELRKFVPDEFEVPKLKFRSCSSAVAVPKLRFSEVTVPKSGMHPDAQLLFEVRGAARRHCNNGENRLHLAMPARRARFRQART
ncbi:MAG: hypothetical protein ACRENP_22905, partial [Longimicrobiales bacterium]